MDGNCQRQCCSALCRFVQHAACKYKINLVNTLQFCSALVQMLTNFGVLNIDRPCAAVRLVSGVCDPPALDPPPPTSAEGETTLPASGPRRILSGPHPVRARVRFSHSPRAFLPQPARDAARRTRRPVAQSHQRGAPRDGGVWPGRARIHSEPRVHAYSHQTHRETGPLHWYRCCSGVLNAFDRSRRHWVFRWAKRVVGMSGRRGERVVGMSGRRGEEDFARPIRRLTLTCDLRAVTAPVHILGLACARKLLAGRLVAKTCAQVLAKTCAQTYEVVGGLCQFLRTSGASCLAPLRTIFRTEGRGPCKPSQPRWRVALRKLARCRAAGAALHKLASGRGMAAPQVWHEAGKGGAGAAIEQEDTRN
eukprot:gene23659-biopygen2850